MRDWGERDPRWRGIRSEMVTLASGVEGIDPTEVHLLRAGPDDGDRPVLLVHGLGGSASNWLDVMAPLATSRPVVAMDLPGFGLTRPPDPRAARLRPQVRFLARLLDVLGWGRAEVHGNSMGGLLAVMLARSEPRRVSRLVLTSPALPPPRRPAAVSPAAAARFAPFLSWRLGAMVLERLYVGTPAEEIRRGTLDLILGDLDDLRPALQHVQLENIAAGQQEAWRVPSFARAAADLVSTLAWSRDVHRAVDAVTVPTLIVWGEHDQLVGRHTIDAVAARRPDWSRVDLAGVGHVPMLEAPDRWLQVVDAVLPSGQ